jgi:predicted AAA+ superfamily ATPase
MREKRVFAISTLQIIEKTIIFVARKTNKQMEAFYRTHAYLVEHINAPVRRDLMDEIDWSDRLIGIKGTRGVGKTTFLLQYAKEKFGTDRSCLFINMNNFYFSGHSIVDFAYEFQRRGGKVLLIDQVFKYDGWSKELRMCYDRFPGLKIVFTGSSVMRLKEENLELRDIVKSYNLRGFSFREFLNLQTGMKFKAYTLDEILRNHEQIAKGVLSKVKPLDYFQDYLHHGFYPFFLEKRNFSENLLKTMNMMVEVDILLIKQILMDLH